MRRGNGALAAIFFDFGRNNFPFKNHFKKRFKIVVFPFWRRDVILELQIAAVVCCHSIVFAAQCLQILVEWLRQGSSLQHALI